MCHCLDSRHVYLHLGLFLTHTLQLQSTVCNYMQAPWMTVHRHKSRWKGFGTVINSTLPKVHGFKLCCFIQEHMSAQFEYFLTCVCWRMRMKPTLLAPLNQLQAPGRRQPEDVAFAAGVCWCHHNRHSFSGSRLHFSTRLKNSQVSRTHGGVHYQ